MNKTRVIENLMDLGINRQDAETLRRISMTLHRWFELECGDGSGWIERDEATDKPFFCYSNDPASRRYPVADREKGAMKRLNTILGNYPELGAYVQGDPRGASLYIYRKDEARLKDYSIESLYSSIGVAVYK